jgi:uncharacterized membrane protein
MRITGILVVAACLAGAAGSAAAQQLMVTGVAEDDVLNIRAAPSGSAAIVGWIPPDGFGLVATGGQRTTGSTRWTEIVHQGTQGWVATRYTAALDLQCGGTEPFWGLTFGPSGAVFSWPEGPDQRMSIGEWGQAVARPWPQTVWLGRAGSRGVAVISKVSCSDGMSDFDYAYDMTLILPDGTVYSGCCDAGG